MTNNNHQNIRSPAYSTRAEFGMSSFIGLFTTLVCAPTSSPLLKQVFNFLISFMTPIINGILEKCLTGLVAWQHNTSDDETATRLMYGVFQTQVGVQPLAVVVVSIVAVVVVVIDIWRGCVVVAVVVTLNLL